MKTIEKISKTRLASVEQKKENLIESTQVVIFGPLPIDEKDWKEFVKRKKDSPCFYIFIDGGIDHLKRLEKDLNVTKDSLFILTLGDGDSSKQKLDIRYKAEKNQTDFQLALSHLGGKIEELYLWGLIGGKLDHQLAVLGDLHQWVSSRVGQHTSLYPIGQLYSFSKEVMLFPLSSAPNGEKAQTACPFDWSLPFRHYGRFSVISVEENTFHITGQCRYQVKDELTSFPLSGRTISNWGGGDIEVKAVKPFYVVLN